MKKNFEIDEKVVMCRLGGDMLEGRTGLIVGKSFTDPVIDSYIVLLDKPTEKARAVVMTEACLERIS